MSTYLRKPQNIASRFVAGETVIVHLPNGEMTVLDGSGSLVWALLDGSRTPEEVSKEIAQLCGLTSNPEISEFTSKLLESKLLIESLNPSGEKTTPNDKLIPEKYSTPQIVVQQVLETLAGMCTSGFTGQFGADCRTLGSCFDAMT